MPIRKNKKRKHKGVIIAIGGHEDKSRQGIILKELRKSLKGGKLVVFPFGSEEPKEVIKEYRKVFHSVGIKNLSFINLESRDDAKHTRKISKLKDASGIFIAGGDQNKITATIACTPFINAIRSVYENNGIIAGTSAGASVLSHIMLVYSDHEENEEMNDFSMGPGLGLLPKEVIIDQHFAQRNRFGRLLNVVAKNPGLLAVGLSENTAIELRNNQRFRVLGEGLVYVFDGSSVKFTDLKNTAFNISVHIMSDGYEFDVCNRCPVK